MKALIAMSGGVDSSVAAKLMLDQGYECVGCTMKLYNNPDAGCRREDRRFRMLQQQALLQHPGCGRRPQRRCPSGHALFCL